jgi:branched-chain amino acid transport system substrate-binding protein
VLALACWGFTSEKADNNNKEYIRLGMVALLTGPAAAVGEDAYRGARMAVEETNAKGGINGRPLILEVADYAYDAKKALPAYQSLRNKGLNLFLLDGSTAAAIVGPEIVKNKEFSIVGSALTPAYTDNNVRTCRIGITADVYAPSIYQKITEKRLKPRIAFLVSANEAGESIRSGIKKEIESQGGEIIVDEAFDITSTDFRTQLTKIKGRQSEIDGLVVINYVNTVETMFRQMGDLKIVAPVFSDNWTMRNPNLKTLALAEGVIFADYNFSATTGPYDTKEAKNYKNNYRRLFSAEPGINGANAYDAVMIFAAAAEMSDTLEPIEIARTIVEKLGDYDGITGKLSFDNDCEAERVVNFRTVEAGIIK